MIDILFQDDKLIAINKPSGLASQPGEGVGSNLVDCLEAQLGYRPFLVHRLDKETSGVMLVARDAASASMISELLSAREVEKRYHALCVGIPPEERGRIDAAIRAKGLDQEALTLYRVLERWALKGTEAGLPASVSRLELDIYTGRTHQIRIHLAGSGWPVIGDDRHGDFKANKALKKALGAKRLMLACVRMSLPGYPAFEASEPAHMAELAQRLSLGAKE